MPKNFSLSSMTGYGSALVDCEVGRFTISIQSVNRRHLEVQVSLPAPAPALEAKIREQVASRLSRGQVQLLVELKGEKFSSYRPNLAIARSLKEGWQKIYDELGIEEPFDPHLLAGEEALFEAEELSLPQAPISAAVEEALTELVLMRHKEGAALKLDLEQRLHLLETGATSIEAQAEGGANRFRKRLIDRLEEISGGEEIDERLLREVALFAEKIDITEELVRFRVHLNAFRETLQVESPVGKKLEFLLQEILRECNTMGAKGHLVVNLKCEIEKMREQVQNVE